MSERYELHLVHRGDRHAVRVTDERGELLFRANDDSTTYPHVLRFASVMEAKLAANRHKGDRAGWLSVPTEQFIVRLARSRRCCQHFDDVGR